MRGASAAGRRDGLAVATSAEELEFEVQLFASLRRCTAASTGGLLFLVHVVVVTCGSSEPSASSLSHCSEHEHTTFNCRGVTLLSPPDVVTHASACSRRLPDVNPRSTPAACTPAAAPEKYW